VDRPGVIEAYSPVMFGAMSEITTSAPRSPIASRR